MVYTLAMPRGEVFIPCPTCRAVVLYDAGPDGHPFCETCVVCGRDFPPHLLEAVAAFLKERRRVRRPDEKSLAMEDVVDFPRRKAPFLS